MQITETTKHTVTVQLDREELVMVSNALNEICHGLDIEEFSTRMGADKREVLKLLHAMSSAVDRMD